MGALTGFVCLAWWPLTDRLDLPKTLSLVAGVIVLATISLVRHRRLPPMDMGAAVVASLGLVLLVALPREGFARVEGWAPWVAALLAFSAARRVNLSTLGRAMLIVLLLVSLACVPQVLGLDFLNRYVAMDGRRVVGTLGGPGHLGWTIALLLPFAGAVTADSRRVQILRVVALTLGVAALVWSGSRTAWAMAIVAAPLWLQKRDLLPVAGAAVAGLAGGIGIAAVTDTARLAARLTDLGQPAGTAAGRLYLWRVYASQIWPHLSLFGNGPESFARLWPFMQDPYLAAHPQAEIFRSDLRHAHADAVEMLLDFGALGLGLLTAVVVQSVRNLRERWERRAGLAVVLAAAVGGLAAPVLFFAPTLLLAAIGAGVCWLPAPVRRRALAVPLAVLLMAAAAAVSMRTVSEIARSRATLARVEGHPERARDLAERAARVDARNPLAWMEVAMSCAKLEDFTCAKDAIERAERDLPTDSVRAFRRAVDSL